MTDRHAGYLVTLDSDMRDDDAQAIICAIGLLKGVAFVEPMVADPASVIAENRARRDLWRKLMDVFDKDRP